MEIKYCSTRGGESGVSASTAILNGLASDGGLYVPEQFPELNVDWNELAKMSYQETAYLVLSSMLSDYSEEELKHCIESAYDEKFDTQEIAPLVKKGNAFFLELFHGKTIAFKDMALSILPYLMTTAARKNGISDKIVILTATSGDTGKAAMAGFEDVPGTEIIVFYPKDGVSHVQELQMVTQKGQNTHVAAIRGNFDDAQTGVKKIFGDRALSNQLAKEGFRFSSANSINIGRLVPQIAYYVYAYGQLIRQEEIKAGDLINITVPTGNFGNILAAYYAKQMGLPVAKLICASNQNKVLFDFFSTGTYDRNREFYLTSSPSMDILVSSNLERLLFKASGNDTEKTADLMKKLSEGGVYSVSAEMRQNMSDFYGGFANEDRVARKIDSLYETTGYVIDPHTAVAAAVYEDYRKKTGDATKTVIASTASPYKFARSVLHAIGSGKYDVLSDIKQIDVLNKLSGVPVPNAIEEIKTAPIRHNTVIDIAEMKQTICEMIGVRA